MPIDLEDQSCIFCRFFIPDGDNQNGECHRCPPRVKRNPGRDECHNASIWPAVMTCDWCGEFQEKSNAQR